MDVPSISRRLHQHRKDGSRHPAAPVFLCLPEGGADENPRDGFDVRRRERRRTSRSDGPKGEAHGCAEYFPPPPPTPKRRESPSGGSRFLCLPEGGADENPRDEHQLQPIRYAQSTHNRLISMARILITALLIIAPVAATAAGCHGIEIHSWAAYQVEQHREITEDRWGTTTTQCASVVVTLPGYYGKILDSETTKRELRERFFARMADGRAIRPNWIQVPSERVDTSQKYRVRMCFGRSRISVVEVNCR